MQTTYTDLQLYIADQAKPAIGCGYYYIVTTGSQSHTAFRTKHALKQWLKVTGLKIGKRKSWLNRSVELLGCYTKSCEMLNNKDFFMRFGGFEPYYALDNGEYIQGFYEVHAPRYGNILHFQNPNTDRTPLDYKFINGILNGKTRYEAKYA